MRRFPRAESKAFPECEKSVKTLDNKLNLFETEWRRTALRMKYFLSP
jgi:hypothetical protein